MPGVVPAITVSTVTTSEDSVVTIVSAGRRLPSGPSTSDVIDGNSAGDPPWPARPLPGAAFVLPPPLEKSVPVTPSSTT